MKDKDLVILKYLDEEQKDNERELREITKETDAQSDKLDSLIALMSSKLKTQGKKVPQVTPGEVYSGYEEISIQFDNEILSYDELYKEAELNLRKRGLDVENIDFESLLSDEEINEIIKELNAPLTEREKWTKSDFIAVFIAALIGCIADLVLGDRNNKLTGQNSKFSKWLNEFHKHEPGAPIDYQGPHFGGGHHRNRSRGHDLLRFIEAILMFKNGEFRGVYYKDGVAHYVKTNLNQFGNAYQKLGTIDAIVRYVKHMLADFCSTYSLPFPGSSFLAECGNRDLRKFSAVMYENGFNLKNIMTQAFSTVAIELILRVYNSINAVKAMNNSEIAEDYSNFDKAKEFINPSNKEKLYELLLTAHAITTGFNIGKIIIKKAPWEINVTEIFAVIKYARKVIKANKKRHNKTAILFRNSQHIHEEWDRLEDEIEIEFNNVDEILVIE